MRRAFGHMTRALAAAVSMAAGAIQAGAVQAGDAPADPASRMGLRGTVTLDRLPPVAHPVLQAGAAVWDGRCAACHAAAGDSGAPKITRLKAWEPRVAQGLPVLFAHAIEGFMGPRYTEMPPRGGDPDLTDDQVKAAVAFMLWMSGGRGPVEDWLNPKEN